MESFFSLELNSINAELGLRYLINLLAVIMLTRGIYYRNYKRSELFLTFFSFNTIIFFVSYMLNKVEMTIGAAFGLFAVFSILRYRTEGISAKDMTYLFLSIAIGLLSSVSKATLLELGLLFGTILLVIYLLESNLLMHNENSKTIFYDNIQLVKNNVKDELLADLKDRTGLNIKRFKIEEIDFLKDACRITIYYYEE